MKTRAAPSPAPPRIHKHLSGSLKAQWKSFRKQLQRCQRHCSEEAVHDLRVEIRRLLSALELVGAFLHEDRVKKARKLLKHHLDTFAELRDIQVQCLAAHQLARRFPAAAPFLSALTRREERAARQTRKHLRRSAPVRLGRLLDHFRDELRTRRKSERGPHDFAAACRAVGRAFAVALRRRERLDPEVPDTIHRTRIAFKKFRYMVEALAPLLPRVTPARLRSLRNYQALMGPIQDAEVLLRSYDDFCQGQDLAAPAVRALRAELDRHRRQLIQIYLRHADQLSQFWPAAQVSNPHEPIP